MLEAWNNKELLSPPVNTFLCKNKIEIKSLLYATNNSIEVLGKQSPLHKESAILSRFLYKFDKKFRNDIGYRNLKKVNTTLKKYLALNIKNTIENFASVLPKGKDELYLPTRQMLEYVLIKIMCLSKLMMRVVICSKQSAVFYLDRIKRGEAHWMSLMPYALLCRIWSMALVLLQHSCNWYNQFYSNLNKLELKGICFLPANFKLPTDLESWLDLNNLNDYGRFDWTNKMKINIEPMFVDDEGVRDDLCENILDYVNQINEDEDKLDDYQVKLPSVEDISLGNDEIIYQHELGVAVSRDNTEKSLYMQKGNQCSHSIDKVTNNTSLNEFLNKEEELRNECDNNSLTSHLSFMQWQSLKTCLQNVNCDKTVPRKLNRKIQKIWKEKCLDYK